MNSCQLLIASLLCVLGWGCRYDIVLGERGDAMGEAAAPPSVPATSEEAKAGDAQPAPTSDDKGAAAAASVGNLPQAPTPTPQAPAGPTQADDDCSARVVSRSKPCSNDPDPCGLNSGWDGDAYCLKPPPAGEGVQIHFGPKDYNRASEYVMEPGQEFYNSMLAHVPLSETKYGSHITVQTRPGVHHWNSMSGPAGAREGFYADTGCGQSTRFMASGDFGRGQNLIYDNPPDGVPAPENEGTGRTIAGNSSACVALHAYNFTDGPQLREMWINLYFIDASKVTQRAGAIALIGGLGLNVPPGEHRELRYSARFPEEGRILQLIGSRNEWTTRLAVWLNDELIYDSRERRETISVSYDSITTNPPIDGIHDGAKSGIVAFTPNDTLTYRCFIENASDHTLSFGEADGGEMCDLWGSTVGGSLTGVFQ